MTGRLKPPVKPRTAIKGAEQGKGQFQKQQSRLGQSFDDFLKEQGTYEETTERAIKRVVAFQLAQIMAEQDISKAEMARRLSTSRAQLDRLLDPEYDGVTLGTLTRAAKAVGRSLRLELV